MVGQVFFAEESSMYNNIEADDRWLFVTGIQGELEGQEKT